MSDLIAARTQMAMSLAFHIVFAVVGMALPVLMAIAEWRALRTGDKIYLELARRWAKGAAILFAVGAVSGTVLSFELGLLWPDFMALAGPWVGLPFALEGYAFFLEAIFIGVYLYGWDRLSPRAHWWAGIGVAISGLASGVFVMAVNAFMNAPGAITSGAAPIDPWAAFKSAAFPTQAAHMALAAYASVSIAVLGIHAWRLLKDPDSAFHRAAVRVALIVALISVPLQIASGDLSAKHIAVHQPVKLAAAEGLFVSTSAAPISIGGIPDTAARETRFAIHIPYGLSFLAFGDPHAHVRGLDTIDEDLWPPVLVVHLAFQAMVGCGTLMVLLMLGAVVVRVLLRQPPWQNVWFLRAAALCTPLGLVAVEAGWVVTEVGRQPWVLFGVMRTHDAVTPMPHLQIPLALFFALYLFLGVVVLLALRRHVFAAPRKAEAPAPP